jgi:hypothetical protein
MYAFFGAQRRSEFRHWRIFCFAKTGLLPETAGAIGAVDTNTYKTSPATTADKYQ